MKIGILTSQPEEVEHIIEQIEHKHIVERAGRVFYEGVFFGTEMVIVFSNWGKVAAALTVSILCSEFDVERIISVGVASAVVPELKMGDIVVGQRLFQHDMDMRPLFRQYEIPLLGVTSFATPEYELNRSMDAVHVFLKQEKEFRKLLQEQGVAPQTHIGDIASGDLFITGATRKATINRNLPSVLCVDMESAAIAQACFDLSKSFAFVRYIADTANEDINANLSIKFKRDWASQYSYFLIKAIAQIA